MSRKYIDDHSVMLSNTAWLLVGNVAYAVFLWGVLVSIAKLGTPEMVGVYSYGFALTTPIFMLFGLRLRFVQISDSKNEAGFDDYLSIRLFTTIVAVLIAIMMGLWLRLSIEVFYVVAIIAIAKGFEAISDIYYGVFYKCERMKHIAVSQIIKGSVSLVVFVSLLYKFGSLLVACTGMAIIWGVVCIFFDCKTVSQSSGIDSRNYKILDLPIFLNFETFKNKLTVFRVIIFKAFPLGIMGFLASLSINVPRYVVESELGIRELGYYAAITYIMLGGVMIMSAVLQSAIPKLSMYAHVNDMRQFKILLIRLLIFSFAVGAFGWFFVYAFGQEFLLFLYGEAYAEYATHLQYIMSAAILNYMAVCFWYALTALQNYWSQLYLFIVDVCIMYFASISFVPKFGIMGAIYAVIVVMTFHFVAGGVVVVCKIAKREDCEG